MLKKILVKTLASPPFFNVGSRLYKQHVPILMLHRFQCDELGIQGHQRELVIRSLEFLRRKKYTFLSVEDVASAVSQERSLPERSIAFSLDDGYCDQVDVGAEIFAKYDCPATYFIATGFVNNDLWCWDAKISYVLEHASFNNLTSFLKQSSHFSFDTNLNTSLDCTQRGELANKIIFSVTDRDIDAIDLFVRDLSLTLQVDIPTLPPKKHSAATWAQLLHAENRGLKVAAHTHSHPLLSRETDENVRWQMQESKAALKRNGLQGSNVFCYPVGRAIDFGKRDECIAQEQQFIGAVSAIPGTVDITKKDGLFAMPRLAFPDNIEDVIQYASWIEVAKNSMRG